MSENHPFYLKLEGMAADMRPDEALEHLAKIGNRLKLNVQAEINGIKVHVTYPATPQNIERGKQELVGILRRGKMADEKFIIV